MRRCLLWPKLQLASRTGWAVSCRAVCPQRSQYFSGGPDTIAQPTLLRCIVLFHIVFYYVMVHYTASILHYIATCQAWHQHGTSRAPEQLSRPDRPFQASGTLNRKPCHGLELRGGVGQSHVAVLGQGASRRGKTTSNISLLISSYYYYYCYYCHYNRSHDYYY